MSPHDAQECRCLRILLWTPKTPFFRILCKKTTLLWVTAWELGTSFCRVFKTGARARKLMESRANPCAFPLYHNRDSGRPDCMAVLEAHIKRVTKDEGTD